jgi:catechol 2,3-dioxygenase-like lactoylglutathione lyase family enzyme
VAHAASPEPPARAAHVDHLILGTRDLDEGIRRFEGRTGVRPTVGGEHPGRGTRNALVSLGPGLTDLTPFGWAVFVPDVEVARRKLTDAGFGLSAIKPGSRTRPDGVRLEWKTFTLRCPKGTVQFRNQGK